MPADSYRPSALDREVIEVMIALLKHETPPADREALLSDLLNHVSVDYSGLPSGFAWSSKDPIPRDGPNEVCSLGLYRHLDRSIVLFPARIEHFEAHAGFGQRFGKGSLFSCVLFHEAAHWLNYDAGVPVEPSSPSAVEAAETLAELSCYLTFRDFQTVHPELGERLLGCQQELNEQAPTYEYRAYSIWLALCGAARDESLIRRLIQCSSRRGHPGLFLTLAHLRVDDPSLVAGADDEVPLVAPLWRQKLSGFQEAFERLSAQWRHSVPADFGHDDLDVLEV